MHRTLRIILLQFLVWATVFVCLYQAFSKGWLSFLLVPIAAGALPIFIILEYVATFGKRKAYRGAITAVQVVLAGSLLAYFVGALGFGDDPSNAYVLGAFWEPAHSPLAHYLDIISNVGMFVAVTAAITLIGLLIARRRQSI